MIFDEIKIIMKYWKTFLPQRTQNTQRAILIIFFLCVLSLALWWLLH